MRRWPFILLMALLVGCGPKKTPSAPVVKAWRPSGHHSAIPHEDGPAIPLTPLAISPDGKHALSRSPDTAGLAL
jgi:hypothetical protein